MLIEQTSIVACITEQEKRRLKFVRPAPGAGIRALNETYVEGESPATTVMAIRLLTLGSHEAIPFHVHPKKEKFYVFNGNHVGGGYVQVFMYEGETLRKYELRQPGDRLVVPPGTPHAMICWSTGSGYDNCNILVVTSTKDGSDIAWQLGAEDLCKNAHLGEGSEHRKLL